MDKLPKCEHCNKPLKVDDSVFIRIARYDTFGRRIKKKGFCTGCWDRTVIFVADIEKRRK